MTRGRKQRLVLNSEKNTKSSVWSKVLLNFPNCKPENGGFHTKCYMSFTSVSKAKLAPYLPLERKPPDPEPAEQQEKGASLGGSTSPAETSNTGVYKKIACSVKVQENM